MTVQTEKHTALEIVQAIALAPVLLAALIGCIPLLIPCIACRCCKGIFTTLREALLR